MAMKVKQRILVLASGDAEGGGSGFLELVEFTRTDPAILDAEIVGVASNHERGGVWKKACSLCIPFRHFKGPYTAATYRALVEEFRADYVMCSGWLLPVRGLDPARTINIHPGDQKQFGGKGMWGHHVHEAVIAAFKRGEVTQSGVSMHFVLDFDAPMLKGKDPYDKGPRLFWFPVKIREGETPETLASRVNEKERAWQAFILNDVVHGRIRYVDHETVAFVPGAIRIGV